jgi:hypothetical protein
MNEPDITLFKFRHDFDRASHIALCATSIEGIRAYLGKDWDALSRPLVDSDTRLREARKLVKHLIRIASESTDFHCTVDFITRSAALTVDAARRAHKKGQSLAGHLEPSPDITHEHMVPGAEVLRELVRTPATMPLKDVLEPLTYRALVCKKTDITLLDKPELKSALPPVEGTRLAAKRKKLASLPPAFKALMRYDATGLLDALIPVTPRARQLKKDYLEYIGCPT